MSSSRPLREPYNVLYRIKRGLSAYVSYLAACEMNESFSEYVLYEPILRILTARNYLVECEVACPGIKHPAVGDHKRIDFVAKLGNQGFALEVKWASRRSLDVNGDYLKLDAYLKECSGMGRAFLCVFGRQSVVANIELKPKHFVEQGKRATADLGVTRYSCRVFELRR
jgi:hypothetical protein